MGICIIAAVHQLTCSWWQQIINLISVLLNLYEYLSQMIEAVPVNTPLAFINWPLNLTLLWGQKVSHLGFYKKWFEKEINNLDFYSFPVGRVECSESSDWKEADVSLDHLCEGPGRETAFASNPPSIKLSDWETELARGPTACQTVQRPQGSWK